MDEHCRISDFYGPRLGIEGTLDNVLHDLQAVEEQRRSKEQCCDDYVQILQDSIFTLLEESRRANYFYRGGKMHADNPYEYIESLTHIQNWTNQQLRYVHWKLQRLFYC